MNDTKTLTFKDDDISLDVIIKDNTGWLSAKQFATLYGVTRSTIIRYISTTYNNDILNRKKSCALLCTSGQKCLICCAFHCKCDWKTTCPIL